MRLLANSSDFFEVGGHLYNLRFNLAFGRGLPSRYLSISLVKLLTHRCTIACDIKSIGSLAFFRLTNQRFVRSFRFRSSHNGGIVVFSPACLAVASQHRLHTGLRVHFCGPIHRFTPSGVSPATCP